MLWTAFYNQHHAKINIVGFTPQDESKIILAMHRAYDNSSIFRKMLDDWVKRPAPDNNINISYLPNSAQGWTDRDLNGNRGSVELDVVFCEGTKYITDNGEAVNHTLDTVLIHELGHALTGRFDDGAWTENDPDWGPWFNGDRTDYKGANVIETNKIFKQLGYKELNSYIGQDRPDTNVISVGQYTNGAEIDRAVVAYFGGTMIGNAPGNWSTVNLYNSRDLLIGDTRDNVLMSGTGGDFLYGMSGEDRLYGGDGRDFIDGGLHSDFIYGDGDDEISGKNELQQIYGDDDELYGDDGKDIIYGGRGNDRIFGDGDEIISSTEEARQTGCDAGGLLSV